MDSISVEGRTLELNEEGFLADPAAWDEQAARRPRDRKRGSTASAIDRHWAVVNCIRAHFVEKGLAPMIRVLCQQTGLRLPARSRGCRGPMAASESGWRGVRYAFGAGLDPRLKDGVRAPPANRSRHRRTRSASPARSCARTDPSTPGARANGSTSCSVAMFLRERRLRFDPTRSGRLATLHDPCNLVRMGGIVNESRALLNAAVAEWVETTPNRGRQCAPLLHEQPGTAPHGAVRFSLGPFNTEEEVEQAIGAVREIAQMRKPAPAH